MQNITDEGKQLKAPENVPNNYHRKSLLLDFSETTGTPDMKTTAAQGGRIGAFNGGIQGLMDNKDLCRNQDFSDPQNGLCNRGRFRKPKKSEVRLNGNS